LELRQGPSSKGGSSEEYWAMGESLTQQYPVIEEGYGRKDMRLVKIMTLINRKAPANSVPAAAVIRGGQVLFAMTGRKAYVGCLY
jgi:hypothetical protein